MKDIYVKFEGGSNNKIGGESRDKDHPASSDWLEVHSWTHSIRQPKSATASTSGGHTAERCEHAEMVFTKDIDATSPKIWQACSAGQTYDKVTIDFMRADAQGSDKRVKYLQIILKHVVIGSVSPTVEGEGLPTEAFTLKYATVDWAYIRQDIKGGQLGTTAASWNLAQNTISTTAV
jgi:type VI secretion system secreted protein Hcp